MYGSAGPADAGLRHGGLRHAGRGRPRRIVEPSRQNIPAGGDLVIAWRESDGHVEMTGPVELEFIRSLDAAISKPRLRDMSDLEEKSRS